MYFGAGLIKVERELSGFLVGLVVEVVQVRKKGVSSCWEREGRFVRQVLEKGNESAWVYFDRQE